MAESDLRSTCHNPSAFPQTRWTVVLAAAGQSAADADAALESICGSYWYPLYAFVRRSGHSAHDAQDLTQEFFRRLLEKNWLQAVDRNRGRLRTFLMTAMKRFMAKEWRRRSAQRRGGAQAHVTLDTDLAENRYAGATPGSKADEIYDRQWALTVLELTLERLRNEFASAGKSRDFEILKNCLMAPRGKIDYSEIADRLNAQQTAARVAVHRLRKQFRRIYREEVSHTLSEGADLNEEIRYLAEALGHE